MWLLLSLAIWLVFAVLYFACLVPFHRRWRFDLQTLFIFVTVFAVVCGAMAILARGWK